MDLMTETRWWRRWWQPEPARFRCMICGALTMDPDLHTRWHRVTATTEKEHQNDD